MNAWLLVVLDLLLVDVKRLVRAHVLAHKVRKPLLERLLNLSILLLLNHHPLLMLQTPPVLSHEPREDLGFELFIDFKELVGLDCV